MYDMHYDLLTILYFSIKESNRNQSLERILMEFGKIYGSSNLIGGIANMVLLTPEEMWEEFGIYNNEVMDVKKMFQDSKQFLENLKILSVIPEHANYLYRLNASDYLNVEDLPFLRKNGLNVIALVENKENKYGKSYNEASGGLTEKGKKFIEDAIDLGFVIDLSKTNEETFKGILDIIEEKKKDEEVLFLSSMEKLTNGENIKRFKDLGGYLSLYVNDKDISLLDQIRYLKEEIEFPEERLFIATNDLSYYPNKNKEAPVFPLEGIESQISNLLIQNYGDVFTKKVLVKNPQNLFEKVNSQQKALRKIV